MPELLQKWSRTPGIVYVAGSTASDTTTVQLARDIGVLALRTPTNPRAPEPIKAVAIKVPGSGLQRTDGPPGEERSNRISKLKIANKVQRGKGKAKERPSRNRRTQ